MKPSPTPFSREELFSREPQIRYTGRNLDEIAFPLGGIGAGMVSLGGWGQLRDWEIMNRPAKGYAVPKTFFTLKVHRDGKPPIVKVLQGPVGGRYAADGHSIPQTSGEGLPHFRDASFTGTFPIATVDLKDPGMPVSVTLEAFNPFIPLNDKDSSIPVAILAYTIRNRTKKKVPVTLFGNLTNVTGGPEAKDRLNTARTENGVSGLFMTTADMPPGSPKHGSMAIAVLGEGVTTWPRWKEGWLSKFWEAVAWNNDFPPPGEGKTDTGTIACERVVPARGAVTVTFLVGWHFPVCEHWKTPGITWKNWYASLWSDAWDVARYVGANLDRLSADTRLFRDTLFASTLPDHVLDAVSSQVSILKTPTCLRLEDGTFYGYEGCSNTVGCCEGSCTHVWNYAQALPYLFPSLQRSMSEAHFTNSMQEDGFVQFRMPLPLGTKAKPDFEPAADGQMGTVIQVYREWLVSGDREWLRKMWPYAKRALEFAWKYWDADRDGVMEGIQHNTYDIEFHGPNTMMGSLYLAALRAAEEMAGIVGEPEKAREYRALFEKGSAWMDQRLFNGEYYEQIVNPDAPSAWTEPLHLRIDKRGKDDKYPWPKWQYGKGCISDQLIGQWCSEMFGLGPLFRIENVRSALRSIYRYNWRPSLSDHPGLLRIYAVGDEAGLLVGTWPRGGRPGFGFYFADEVWCGIEYQVASHLIYEGFVEEGLAIVLGLRRRYRGDRRNPWDEIECGHHYSRSLASYALLTALSGFSFSAPDKRIGFSPRVFERKFGCFFSVDSGWGFYRQEIGKTRTIEIEMKKGNLPLRRIDTALHGRKIVSAYLGRTRVKASWEGSSIVFAGEITVEQGSALRVKVDTARR